MILSFSMTTAALKARRKTVTRREWTDAYAEKVKRAIAKRDNIMDAWSASPHRKGEPVGTVRILSIEKEPTHLIPDSDWEAEGFAYMAENGINVGPNQSCEQLWRSWREDKDKQAYTVRFEVVEIISEERGRGSGEC